MKYIRMIIAIIFTITLLASCTSIPEKNSSTRTETVRSEITAFNELQNEEFYSSKLQEIVLKDNVKVFFRGQDDLGIFSEEQIDLQFVYDIFEKNLFISGFIVRDRSLTIETFSDGNSSSFKEIKDSIDTDLIFEFTDISLDTEFITHKYQQDGEVHEFKDGIIASGLSISLKVIIVETGEVGGYFTLNHIYRMDDNKVSYVLLEDKIFTGTSSIDKYIPSYTEISIIPKGTAPLIDIKQEIDKVARKFSMSLLTLSE